MQVSIDAFLIIFLVGVLTVAALNDLRFQKIPNVLTYPAMALALAYHGATSGFDGLLFSAGGLTLGLAILIFPYLMGGVGAGDAKLMGAVGATVGPTGVFIAFLFTAIVGGIYVFIILLAKPVYIKKLIRTLEMILKISSVTAQCYPIPIGNKEKKPKLCYGIAIAVGTLLYVFLELFGHNFPI